VSSLGQASKRMYFVWWNTASAAAISFFLICGLPVPFFSRGAGLCSSVSRPSCGRALFMAAHVVDGGHGPRTMGGCRRTNGRKAAADLHHRARQAQTSRNKTRQAGEPSCRLHGGNMRWSGHFALSGCIDICSETQPDTTHVAAAPQGAGRLPHTSLRTALISGERALWGVVVEVVVGVVGVGVAAEWWRRCGCGSGERSRTTAAVGLRGMGGIFTKHPSPHTYIPTYAHTYMHAGSK